MPEERTKILVIDDDPNICQLVRLYLEKENYQVECAYRGDQGLKMVQSVKPALIVLDIMLPGMDGWEVCRQVRKTENTPILMLTAKDETFDKVLGLELGADDYMTKPFEPKELIARVKAILRRAQTPVGQEGDDDQKILEFENLTINMTDFTITYFGKKMELPPKEMEFLYFLASHPGRVYTREQLLEQVWDFDYYGDSRTVDVHIKRLREKLPVDADVPWRIKTVWGVGYKFEVSR